MTSDPTLNLTLTEAAIYTCLAWHYGHVVSQKSIRLAVWGRIDIDLKWHNANLRRKIAPHRIVNHFGRGYRLEFAVKENERPAVAGWALVWKSGPADQARAYFIEKLYPGTPRVTSHS